MIYPPKYPYNPNKDPRIEREYQEEFEKYVKAVNNQVWLKALAFVLLAFSLVVVLLSLFGNK